MAHVTLQGDNIVIVYNGGRRFNTGISIDRQNPSNLNSLVKRAQASAYGDGAATDAELGELDSLNINAEANRLQGLLNPVPPTPVAPAQPTPPVTEAPAQPRRPRQPRERRETPRAPETVPETPRVPEAPRVPAPPPRPEITTQWIGTQLLNATGRDERGGRTDAADAATTLHANREFVEQFFSDSANATAATIAAFEALHEIPKFRLYLSSQAALRPEFGALQGYYTEHGSLEGAGEDMIRDANTYVRYYLFAFTAAPEGDAAYAGELRQIPGDDALLNRIDIARTYVHPWALGELTEELKIARIMFSLRTPMDADTLTAAALYIRRWNQREGEIAAWQAPQVTPLQPPQTVQPTTAQTTAVEPPATAVTQPVTTQPSAVTAQPEAEPTPLEQFAGENWVELAQLLFTGVREGDVMGLITLVSTLPEDQFSLESALDALGRTDLKDAFDRIFNEYVHSNNDFLSFVRSRPEYRGIANPTVELSSESSDEDRQLIVRAVKDFVNTRADADQALKQDLKILYQDVLGGTNDRLDSTSGTPDVQTIAALAVLAWRSGNRRAQPGEWARELGVTLPPEATQPTTPQPESGREHRPITW